MRKWNDVRKRYIIMEKFGVASIIICFILGIFFDYNVIVRGNIIISIEDIESFSLTILQIQATVGTLIVAIIALIAGSISDSYMGVSVSDFYLNIKPWKLKQKTLIFISLILCLMDVIFYAFKLYNMVFYAFFATLIIVFISIIEIYSAFRGRNTQNQEIEAYINFMLDNNIKLEKKIDILESFVLDWQKNIDSQDKKSYEKYLEIFKKCIVTLWEYGTDEALSYIQQQSCNMTYCLLGSDKNVIKGRGIEFIQDVYHTLWSEIYKCISENKPILNQYKNEFSFFAEICNELIESIDEINVENVEKRVKFAYLTDLVQRVAIWLKYDKGQDKQSEDEYRRYIYDYVSEINELNAFARHIGFYLERQQNKNNIINQSIWANVLNRWSAFSSYNIPKERSEEFLWTKVRIYFSYCYGMLVNQQEHIVKNGLYLTGMNNTISLDNEYQSLLYISIHCYVYYLAVRESDSCVTEDIRQSAMNIWSDKNVKIAFIRFLDMLSENSEWLNLDFQNQIYNIVHGYELFPQYQSVKNMIIEYVVTDFYLFIILFMSHEYFMPELLENNINDKEVFRYVLSENEEKTKALLNSLFKMIYVGNKSEEKIDVEVGLMYNELEELVKRKYKERYIKLAKQAQEKYKASIIEEEICEKLARGVRKKIEEKFATILVESDEKNGIRKVELLNLTDYTEFLDERCIDGYYSHIDGMFLSAIADFLYKRKVVYVRNRYEDFSDDKEFFQYLSVNNLYLYLGSQYILKKRNYRDNEEFNDFLQECETIYTAVLRNGIALKKDSIQVCLHDVNVSIHPQSVREARAEYNVQTGQYKYSIIDGLPVEFEASELKEFLYNNRKVINITAKISIQVNENIIGTIITGRKR